MPLTVQDLLSLDYEVTAADEQRFIDEKVAADTTLATVEDACGPLPADRREAFIAYMRARYAESFAAQLAHQRTEQRFGRTLRRFGRDGRDRERQIRPRLRQRPADF